MIEISLTFTFIFAILAAYFFASARGKDTLISKQNEMISVLRQERDLWVNKALVRHGQSVLGHETKPREKKTEEVIVKPQVVFRNQMAARHASETYKPDTTIHAKSVSYDRLNREEVLKKAGEIIDATK